MTARFEWRRNESLPMLTTLTALLAGAFHVLSGPDHLAAVAPIAALNRTRGWMAGWMWGLGHAAGVVVVATLAVLVRDSLPPVETISAWSERVVGSALVALGFWGLRKSVKLRSGAHTHSGVVHDHLHVGRGPAWIMRLGHVHASFCLGVLHGIAGSSHFLGVLPALALPTRAAALSYIAAFGVGTVVAMSAFAALVGRVGDSSRRTRHAITVASAIMAIVIGSLWLVS